MSISRCVDAHIHLWELKTLRYPWLTPPFNPEGPNGSVEGIASDYSIESYFSDSKSFPIVKVVHVEAGAHPEDALKETQWLQSIADKSTFPHAIVAHAALNSLNLESLLEAHCQHENVRGIRHIINWHPNPALSYTERNLLEDPAFQRGFNLLNNYNLSFDLQIYPNQMQQAYELAKANPYISVILNHMGMPTANDHISVEIWKKGIALLGSLPNVSVKISGFGFIDRQWNTVTMRQLVLHTIDCFGTDRVMFASDYPTDKLFNPFSQAFDAYDSITQDFSANERESMFAENAERIYRI